MTAARAVAEFAARIELATVPPEVRQAARLHFSDALGVGLAASAGPAQHAWSGALSMGGAATCLTGTTSTAAEAALLNGALIHSLEYDDTHAASVIHGSAVAAPAALAMAEAEGASGADALLGYIIAYEVMIRIGLAAPGVFQARGFQVTAVAGALGAASAAARLKGLGVDQITHAVAIAGTQASGLLAFLEDGSSVKALNPGWAAHTGIMAAGLAAAGMAGPPGILEGLQGVMQAFAGTAGDLTAQVATLGRDWHLPDAAFKLYPCCHYIHPFLEAAQNLMDKGLTADRIVGITAHVAPGQAPLICEPWARRQAPTSGYDGKWGLAYCIALMLKTGRVDVAAFERAPDADVITLARKIDWTPMPNAQFPAVFPAKIRVQTSDGQTLSAEIANVQGAPGRPVQAAQIDAKFHTNAARRFQADTAAALLDILKTLDGADDLTRLSGLLRDQTPIP